MRAAFIALITTMLGVGAAFAQDNGACAVAQNLVHADFALPHVAAAIHEQHLDIAVVGSGSSALGGPDGQSKAYPARLEAALAQKLPNVAVKVSTYIKPRQTAADMVKEFDPILADMKPALVIWQTGTADAMRGVDPDEFRGALDEGVETLRAKQADILFINMQYSPRTESVIAAGNYEEVMRFVALQYEVLLFDRFAIMRHWSEMGTFDLFAATKKTDTAERVHDCIGRLLGDVIVEAAKMVDASAKEVH
jgi:GDSL-like Lipase/Acylhydrolase family